MVIFSIPIAIDPKFLGRSSLSSAKAKTGKLKPKINASVNNFFIPTSLY